MNKKVIKTTVAAVCVVAAGMGGLKAYNAANQSEADLLLAENVEALSSGDRDANLEEPEREKTIKAVQDKKKIKIKLRGKASAGAKILGYITINGEVMCEYEEEREIHCNTCTTGKVYYDCKDVPDHC